jgi:hypothetical protein
MVDQLLAEILARPLDEVVAARDEAVRGLKRDKRGEEAAAVARLRRPSPPLWAANRLRDADPEGLRGLLDAGDAVRAAQAALLGGETGAAQRLAEAGDRLSAAVRGLTQSAMQVLLDEGHGTGADAERRLQSMLRAAATGDDPTREALVAGRLLTEPQPAGFDLLAGVPMSPRASDEDAEPAAVAPHSGRPGDAPASPDERSGATAVVGDRERRMELERAVALRQEAAEHAERDAADRRGHIARLLVEAAELQRRIEALNAQIASERIAAEAAEVTAAQARDALDRARIALGQTGGEARQAGRVRRRS